MKNPTAEAAVGWLNQSMPGWRLFGRGSRSVRRFFTRRFAARSARSAVTAGGSRTSGAARATLRCAGGEFFQRDFAIFVGVELGEAGFEAGFRLFRIRGLFGAGEEFLLAQGAVGVGVEFLEHFGRARALAVRFGRRIRRRSCILGENGAGQSEGGAGAEQCGEFVFHWLQGCYEGGNPGGGDSLRKNFAGGGFFNPV